MLRPAFAQAAPALRQGPRPPQHPMAATLEPSQAGGFHLANRAHDGRAGPAGCNQHHRLQQ